MDGVMVLDRSCSWSVNRTAHDKNADVVHWAGGLSAGVTATILSMTLGASMTANGT
jgi:hypothetical protein